MNTVLAGSVSGRGFDEELAQRRALPPWLAGCTFEDAGQGRSGARVIRVLRPGRGDAYLKYATADGAREIVDEYERTRWLAARIRVPEIIAFDSTSDAAFLLTEALTGRNAADAATDDARTVVAGMAHALRGLHSIPSGDCPFDAGLRLRLASALARMDGGMVDEDDFDEARRGMRARDVYGRMMALMPATEDCVVTHGDACPENFIFSGNAFVGFVDCGRAGRADRYQDLALASRNIESQWGAELATFFFAEYGEPRPDEGRLEFYRMLDEFF